MFNIIITVVFIWLMIKAIGFALFAGGVLLLIPLAMVGIAAGVLKSCINT